MTSLTDMPADIVEAAEWHEKCGVLLCLIEDLLDTDPDAFDAEDAQKIADIDAEWKRGVGEPAIVSYFPVPAGWRLVPSRPTQDMLDAALASHETREGEDSEFIAEFRRTYRAMVNASPIAASQRDQWQDIATAPKDGTEVILFEKPFVLMGCWRDPEDGFGFWSDDYCTYKTNSVTHWMPLPAPPKGGV